MTAACTCVERQREFAATLLDPQRAAPPGLKAWNGSDPSVRLAVYRNNVVSSLVDALADAFPVVHQLVGEAFFRAMAAVFVRAAPPRSRVLSHYGHEFPVFIEAFEPARGLPYLADMARLEAARVVAYHAADAQPVSDAVVGLALGSGDRMGELRLLLHPSVQTLASRHAVVTLWAAHQVDDTSAIERVEIEAAQSALILRHALDVLVLPAAGGTVEFVEAVRTGLELGEAAARALVAAPGFDLTGTLTELLAHGALSAIYLPARLSS